MVCGTFFRGSAPSSGYAGLGWRSISRIEKSMMFEGPCSTPPRYCPAGGTPFGRALLISVIGAFGAASAVQLQASESTPTRLRIHEQGNHEILGQEFVLRRSGHIFEVMATDIFAI
jgi:hypothetical protein